MINDEQTSKELKGLVKFLRLERQISHSNLPQSVTQIFQINAIVLMEWWWGLDRSHLDNLSDSLPLKSGETCHWAEVFSPCPVLPLYVAYLSMPNAWNVNQCCRQSLRCWCSWIRQRDQKRLEFRWDIRRCCKEKFLWINSSLSEGTRENSSTSCEDTALAVFGDVYQFIGKIPWLYSQVQWVEEEDDIFPQIVRQWDLSKFIVDNGCTFKTRCRPWNCA